MASLPTVRAHMDQYVHTLDPDTDIHDAIDFLLATHVTGAPVVDHEGRLLGMLSEKDCLRLVARGVDNQVAAGTVADFMSRDVISVPPTMDIYFAAGIFLKNTFRRLAVVQDGRLVGGITRFDILRAIQAAHHDSKVG